ncbi:hypothetical protein AB0F17_32985 [Nonomuraea sp. NPDC026600]|uniref:hypothetical protein n=1 Tax=Nonomuraea sp. NPDC026600 TaxID=3155363 RepID=UPI0033D993AB
MHFTLSTDCRRGLRIIEDIPDIKLCRLEGHNGIGKSTAIRLLQLVTGTQPYVEDRASWKTFREQLVSGTIHVSNIKGANNIEWIIDPTRWPAFPEPLSDTVGAIRIDGRPARLSDVQSLLAVERIVANESFTDTLISRAERAADTIDRAIPYAKSRQSNADVKLEELQSLLAMPSIKALPDRIELLQSALKAAEDLYERTHATRRLVDGLQEAVVISKRLAEVRGHGPELDEQLSAIDQAITQISIERDSLEAEIRTAAERETKDSTAQKAFQNAERQLVRQNTKLTLARTALHELVAQAQLDLDISHLGQLREQAVSRLAQLVSLQPRIHSTPLVLALLDDVIDRLDQAGSADIGREIILGPPHTSSALTIDALKAVLIEQRAAVNERAPSATEERLVSQISQARRELGVLDAIAKAQETMKEAEQDRDKAEDRFRAAAEKLPTRTANSLNDLLASRNALEERHRDYEARKARLHHARSLLGGGQSEAALSARLLQLCKDLDVEASRVHGRLTKTKELLHRQELAAAQAVAKAQELQKSVEEQQRNLSTVVAAIHNRPDLGWLRRIGEDNLPLAHESVSDQIAKLTSLGRMIENARETLRASGATAPGISQALRDLSARFRGSNPTDGTWSESVRQWLSREVTDWFEHEEVREALFPGAQDLHLDLVGMQLSWTAGNLRQTRPLSAFSSGEQVMAFTRARLAQLDSPSPASAENRLIAIDEFGAFIDADRLHRLATYLTDRSAQYPNDQIVVVLPLSFRREIIEDPDEEMSLKIRQLEARGYFVERLLNH